MIFNLLLCVQSYKLPNGISRVINYKCNYQAIILWFSNFYEVTEKVLRTQLKNRFIPTLIPCVLCIGSIPTLGKYLCNSQVNVQIFWS